MAAQQFAIWYSSSCAEVVAALQQDRGQVQSHPYPSDSAVYVRKDDAGLLILHLHVKDLMVFPSSPEVMDQFKVFQESEYKVKWTSRPSLYLGIHISVSNDGTIISLDQDHYIESTLERFAMVNCKAVKSPLPHRTILAPGSDEDVEAAKYLPY